MFKAEIENSEFTSDITALAALESEVSNTANNKGFAYFWAVDRGRGPIRPVNAKALRFVAAGGEVVFAKSARAAPAQHLTEQSMENLLTNSQMAAGQAHGNTMIVWAREFLRFIANFQAQALSRITPRVSGRLAKSYKINVNG